MTGGCKHANVQKQQPHLRRILTLSLLLTTIVPYANSLDSDEMPSNSASQPNPSCLTLWQHLTGTATSIEGHLQGCMTSWLMTPLRWTTPSNEKPVLFIRPPPPFLTKHGRWVKTCKYTKTRAPPKTPKTMCKSHELAYNLPCQGHTWNSIV